MAAITGISAAQPPPAERRSSRARGRTAFPPTAADGVAVGKAARRAAPRARHAALETAAEPDRIPTGALCGWTRAHARARTGDRVATAAHGGSGDSLARAILELSEADAEQNERDDSAPGGLGPRSDRRGDRPVSAWAA